MFRHDDAFLGSGESSGLDSAAITGGAPNAGAVHRVAPVAEVELDALLPGLEGVALGDGGKCAEEEAGGVSHDGSAATAYLVGHKPACPRSCAIDADAILSVTHPYGQLDNRRL